MFVKKFEGDTLDAALQQVKRELGPDAIILKTVTNKGLKGAFKKNRIEITAAISEQSYEKKARVDHVMTSPQQEEFYQAPASRVNNMINNYDDHRTGQSQRNEASTQTASYGNMGLNKVVNSVAKASTKLKNSLDDFLTLEEDPKGTTASGSLDSFLQEAPQKQAATQQHNNLNEESHYAQESKTEMLIEQERMHNDEISSEMKHEIKSQRHQIELLEQKLFEISERMTHRGDDSEPLGIKGLRTTLRSLELSEKIVQKIIKKAVFELTKEDLDDADLVYDFALREINGLVNTDMPLFSSVDTDESPVVTALISENPSGQTSMALKLAVLQEDVKVIRFRMNPNDVDSADFTTKVFKLDVTTVSTLAHLMSEARKALADRKSLILDLKLSFTDNIESKKFIETLKRSFDQLEILVTISGIHSELYNRKILAKYNSFSNGAIISYIDQCLSFGSLLNVHAEYNDLPLKFYGTGPTVPDDIEAATAERILAGMFEL